MNFSGNIIPNSWFRTLCDKSGHPYMNAIVILTDIRYWYTPTEIRDEKSGRTTKMSPSYTLQMADKNF